MLGGSGLDHQDRLPAWLVWDPHRIFPSPRGSLRPPDLRAVAVVFLESLFSLPRRGAGDQALLPGRAAAGPGAGESPHVPAVPVWRQLCRIDLSWFLMKAASACQLASVAARVSIAWGGQLGAKCRTRSADPQGFPRYQCSDWCHSSFLTRLPWSLGGAVCGLCLQQNTQAGHLASLL